MSWLRRAAAYEVQELRSSAAEHWRGFHLILLALATYKVALVIGLL